MSVQMQFIQLEASGTSFSYSIIVKLGVKRILLKKACNIICLFICTNVQKLTKIRFFKQN